MEIKNLHYKKGRIVSALMALLLMSSAQISFAQNVLDLPGNNGYIKSSTGLSISGSFTIEAWIKIEGTGIASSTGSSAHNNIVPLVTKGRSINDGPDAQEVNYFVGFDRTTRRLQADYEDLGNSNNNHTGEAGSANGVLPLCRWVHVAVVCDLTSTTKQWLFYVDGVAAGTTSISWANANDNPCSGSIAPMAIGSSHQISNALADDGPFGFFDGQIDEVRIWNVARSATQISTNYKNELTSGTGLIARFGMNEGTGVTAANSVNAASNGTLSGASLPTWVSENPSTPATVNFNGSTGYITFGSAPSLNTGTFTLEAWIRREGTGVGTATGSTGGLTDAIPIITKGRSLNDDPGNNVNYFLGINTATNQVGVDFEQTSVSGNAPNNGLIGNTILSNNVWYHVAASYGGGVWKIYVNGVLDAQKTIAGAPVPEIISNAHAAIGTAILPDGVAAGFFNGKIDEVRIWNTVRTQTEIQNNMYSELYNATGLLGRWGMNDICASSNYINSVRGGVTGTAVGGFTNVAQNFVPVLTEGNPFPSNGTPSHANENIRINRTDLSGGTASFALYARILGSGSAFSLVTSQSGVNGGDQVNFWWPTMQPLTTYEWYVQMVSGTNVYNGRVYTFTSAGTLPVRLNAFTARAKDGAVLLNWNTSNELNNGYFIIERSADGKNYQVVSQVNAQAVNGGSGSYQAIDASPLTGVSYYRLKQVDKDGQFAYSPVARVNINTTGKFGFDVFPNPVTGNTIRVSFQAPVSGLVEVKIFDLAGRLQLNTKMNTSDNGLSFQHRLAKGVYILKISSQQSEVSNKIIIQ